MNIRSIKLIDKLNKRAKQAKRKCLYKGCNSHAIESHLLQRQGVISEIIESNHVIELTLDLFKNPPLVFKSIGWKQAFAFPGFCNNHDNDIFQEIEKEDTNYYKYRSQLLLSYRATMIEKRKKEIMVDFYNRVLGSSTLRTSIVQEYFFDIEEKKRQQILGISDENYYENIFLSNIHNEEVEDFEFITFELPKVEMCSSAVFTYETTNEINMIEHFHPEKINEPLTQIYFNLIPITNSTIVIIGCLKERKEKCWDYISSFKQNDYKLSYKRISDLLLNQVENWIVSKTFYNNYILSRKDEIIKLVNDSRINTDERKDLDFNIFYNK